MSTPTPIGLCPPTRVARWWPAPIRLIVGYGFLAHGLAKLAHGEDRFAHILGALRLPAADALAWMTVGVEILGGLAVLAGALTPLVVWPMAVVLIVAIVTVHLPNGFSSIKLQSVDAAGAHFGQPGYETDLLYLAGLLALLVGGAGPLSLDEAIARRLRARPRTPGDQSG